MITKKKKLNSFKKTKKDKNKDMPLIKKYNSLSEKYLNHKLIKKLITEFKSKTLSSNEIPKVKFFINQYSFDKSKKDNYGRLFKYDINNNKTTILDFDVLSASHDFYNIGHYKLSNNEKYITYTVDILGRRLFYLYLKDLENNKTERIAYPCTNDVGFSSDSLYLYYIVADKVDLRSCKVYSYNICEKTHQLIYKENNRSRMIHLKTTSDLQYPIIMNRSYNDKTPLIIERNNVRLIFKTKKHMRIDIDHWLNTWYILKKTYNKTEIYSSNDLKNYTLIIHNSKKYNIERFLIKGGYIITFLKGITYCYIGVYDIKNKTSQLVNLSDYKYSVNFPYLSNLNIYDTKLILKYNTFINPTKLISLNLNSGKIKLLHNYKNPNFNTNIYTEKIIKINKYVYVTILYHNKFYKPNMPCVLYGYGSYGSTIDPDFHEPTISLLDRGFLYCVAHVRGGGFTGYYNWLDGKMLRKKNSFYDFINCAKWLFKNNYTSPSKMAIWGRSAGGLLIGSVINMYPSIANLAILGVPFVDVINTMMDSNQPLTTEEYKEWGNPEDSKIYKYMESYDPIQNINKQANYPNIYIYSNINDTLVNYKQVLNYYNKINTSDVFLNKERFALLNLKLKYGHGQATRKQEKYYEMAQIISMIILHTDN